MRAQLRSTTSPLGILFFILFECVPFLSTSLSAANDKEIKIHPRTQKESVLNVEDLKKKAEGYNRQAIELFETGQYVAAQELWEKAIDLVEHPRGQAVDLEAVDEEQQPLVQETPEAGESSESSEIVEKYQTGLALLEQKAYADARALFMEIDAMQPGYRNTKKYLIVIDELMREESSPVMEDQMDHGEENQILTQENAPPEMMPEPAESAAFDRQQEETQWQEAVAEAEQKLVHQIEEKVEPIYQRAVQHYKDKKYEDAKSSFEEAQVLSPDYKLTAKYLDGIDDDILYARHQREEEQHLAEERARRQDEMEFKKTIAAKEEGWRRELAARTQQVYQQAIHDFKDRRFEEAEDNFRKVQSMSSGYKLTDKYLGRIEQARLDEERRLEEEGQRRQVLAQQKEQEDLKRTVEKSERVRQQRLHEEAEAVYQKARVFYGQGDLEKAKFNFNETEKILPDYRSVKKYLDRINEDISRAGRLELERARQEKFSVPLGKDIKAADAGSVPASSSRSHRSPPLSQRLPEGEEPVGKRQEAERYYQQAKDFYSRREFVKAKEIFEKVNVLVKGYQATGKFLARIDADIKREEQYREELRRRAAQRQAQEKKILLQKEMAVKAAAAVRQEARGLKDTLTRIKKDRKQVVDRKVEGLYREAQSDYKSHLYALAKERFGEVQRISPGYKSTEEYLARIADAAQSQGEIPAASDVPLLDREALPVSEKTPVEQPVPQKEMPDDGVAAAYDEGISLFKRKQYVQAREKFGQVVQLHPDYKSTTQYLNRIDSAIERQYQRQFKEQQDILAGTVRKEKRGDKIDRQPKVQMAAQKAERARQAQDKKDARRAVKEEANKRIEKKRMSAAANAVQEKQLLAQKTEQKRRAHRLAQVERKYARALAAYKADDFVNAKKRFGEVEALWPDFKETARYLSRIDGDIETQKQKPKEVMAAPIEVMPQKNPQTADEQLRLRADGLFQEAVRLYQVDEMPLAREKFAELDRLIHGYKSTRKYLARIDRDLIQQQKKTERVKQARDKEDARRAAKDEKSRRENALRMNAQKNKEQVKPSPVKAQGIQLDLVNAPDVDAWEVSEDSQTIQNQQARIRDERKNVQTAIQANLDQMYIRAVGLYQSGYYAEARNLFEQIAAVRPSFKGTKNYLVAINRNLGKLPSSGGVPLKNITAPPVYVKSRAQTVADALDTVEDHGQ